MRRTLAIILALASTLSLLACDGGTGGNVQTASALAQDLGLSAETTPADTGTRLEADSQRPCAFWWDGTTSIDPQNRSAIISQLIAQFPSIAAREHLGRCDVFEFGEKPWAAAPFYQFSVPPSPVGRFEESPCAPLQESETTKWFREAHERALKRRESACNDKRSELRNEFERTLRTARDTYEQDLARTMSEFQRVLLARPPLTDHCTSITDLFTRVARSRSPLSAIVVTDAIETCRPALAPIEAPKEDIRVVVVLVDSKTPAAITLAEDFDRRRFELRKVAPWLQIIVPFWRLDRDELQKSGAAEPAAPEK